MHTFDTPAPVTAVLDIPAGRIRLIAADRTDTSVEILPDNAASSRDVKAAEQTDVTYDDGILRITAPQAKNPILGNRGSVEVTVQLPAGSRVEATTALAELRGVGRLGDVAFEGAQGTVRLDETAGARLTLQSGDITVGRLNGPAHLTTQQGDLTVTEAVHAHLTLHTHSGDITTHAAPGTSATLDAKTTHGRIHNTLKNTGSAGATLTIHATTTHGNITAHSH
ncbi:DUF4097 family beta strand repeat-containing protein [Streptomyces sp. NPDC091292]|uniref:DUF4097 family beta strand repeat-containing protein n=1 Tax=Streptomyces sp. NPDC091292 TaxID=3365991 RepID=UPI0038292B7D